MKTVAYENDIAPIFETKCTPCHYPEKGKKKHLNTYAAVKSTIDDIIERVEKKPDEKGYMPFRGKKEALTASEIKTLKDWVDQDFGK